MSRGSFSRSVARAASSGGGRAYGSRPPVLWYVAMALIVLAGVSLIVYSRNERLHPSTTASKTAEGPTASQHWEAAYAIDICGKVQPALAANSNLSSVGIRTFGNGLIDMDPGALASSSNASTEEAKYEGAKATLGLFASSYPSFTLTATSIKLPGKKQPTYTNGDHCPGAVAGKGGDGTLVAWEWASPKAKKGHQITGDITAFHLTNGVMVTIAFVPPGTTVPEPKSKSALETSLASGL